MALSQATVLIVVAFSIAGLAPVANAGRRSLRQIINATNIPASQRSATVSRSALTAEMAEASANAGFSGVNRLFAPSSRRSYSTVDGHTSDINTNNRAVQPRARSAQDLPGGPNRTNGAGSMPALVMGGVAHAQTYEGATATATTDSLALNRGGSVAISNSRITTTAGTLTAARPGQSYAVTSREGVGSNALSGNANGQIVLAQADKAVALAQAERN